MAKASKKSTTGKAKAVPLKKLAAGKAKTARPAAKKATKTFVKSTGPTTRPAGTKAAVKFLKTDTRPAVKGIVAQYLPGAVVIPGLRPTGNDAAVAGESGPGPSVAAIRRKYLGTEAAFEEAVADSGGDDVEVVRVLPRAASSESGSSSPRTVIIAKSKGIVGMQG